jgi:hypothetical protein
VISFGVRLALRPGGEIVCAIEKDIERAAVDQVELGEDGAE